MLRVYYENFVSRIIRSGSERVNSFAIGEISPSRQMLRVYKIAAVVFADLLRLHLSWPCMAAGL